MRIIRKQEVLAKVGLKHAEIHQRMLRGEFPRSVPLGPKAVGWLESEIDEWIDARVAERDQGAARYKFPKKGAGK